MLLAVLAAGCGYFKSGTWKDDPKNFERAWGVSPPEELNIVHSWYWRSPHFTREEAYYFEFEGLSEIAEAFVEANNMRRVEAEVLDSFGFCFTRPEWFASKPSGRYSAWTSERGTALLLREEATDRVYIHACQL